MHGRPLAALLIVPRYPLPAGFVIHSFSASKQPMYYYNIDFNLQHLIFSDQIFLVLVENTLRSIMLDF